jgi:hypothetical protein
MHIVPINDIMSLVYFSIYVMYYVLCVGVLDDGDRLHGSTLLYTILVIDVLLFTTICAMIS